MTPFSFDLVLFQFFPDITSQVSFSTLVYKIVENNSTNKYQQNQIKI